MTADPRVRSCVIGLGNPGEEYRLTRHNVGFHVVDVLAARIAVDIRRPEYRALTAEGVLGRSMVLLMKPQTYMNASGRSAAEALNDLGLSPDRLVVVYDDLDLPIGRLRIRASGGAGGHRGVASLLAEIGTGDFARVRVGVGRPRPGVPVVEHVLSPFEPDELEVVGPAVALAADAVEHIVNEGIRSAMDALNGR